MSTGFPVGLPQRFNTALIVHVREISALVQSEKAGLRMESSQRIVIMQPSLFKLVVLKYQSVKLFTHARLLGDKIFQGGSKYFQKLLDQGVQIFRYSPAASILLS